MVSTHAPAVPATSERDIDVRYYADLLWRGRMLLLSGALVGLGLGILTGYLQVPEYQAAAMIQIEPPTPTFMSVTDALVGGGSYWQNTDFYNTQFKILRSKGLAEKVIERLVELEQAPPFKGSPEATDIFMSHVSVAPIPETRLVLVQVVHGHPETAARWANTLAEVYISQTLSTRVEAAKRAYDWLQERLAATQGTMRDAQDRLFKSYQNQDLFVPEGSVSAVTTSITKLNEDYIEAQSRLIAIEAALKQVADMRKAGRGLDTLPQVATDGMVIGFNTQLGGLNVDLSQLKDRFKDAHPEVQKLQGKIDELVKLKNNRAGQIVEGLRVESAQLQKRVLELKSAIDEQKSLATTQSQKATELEALKKEAESAKSLYEVLLQKLNETDIAASIKSTTASVVEKAAVPRSPVRPEKRKIAGVAALLGLALGIGLVLARDFLANTIKDPEEIERFLHLDLIAAVPRYDEANVHLVTEAYQNLRTALLFARRDEGGQVVLITGTAPQEGKTTTLVNIAKLLASSGEKTIVLDFDLRRAQLHARLGLTREPGITNFFVKHEDLDALIRPTRVPNLFALTAGPLPPNPPAILTRKNVPDFLDHLKRHFEWVLVDSPPLASVTDALLLARHADMAVVVVQHNKVDRKVIRRSVQALRKATDNVLGAVLNAVDMKAKGYYYYYYQHATGSEKTGPKPVAAARR